MTIDRRLFLGGAGVVAGSMLSGLGPASAQGYKSGTEAITKQEWDAMVLHSRANDFTCSYTAEYTEGPFYYESSLRRRDVTEGQPGERLRLKLRLGSLGAVQKDVQCSPLIDGIVDIWQSNAAGLYSNVGGEIQYEDTTGQTFLRGHQLTDENGYVEFDTIVPGWEIVASASPKGIAQRTNHIHVKAYHGRQVITTQLLFPDDLLEHLYAEVEPYKSFQKLTAPGLDYYVDRVRNQDDYYTHIYGVHPLEIERVDGVLTAEVTLGMISNGNMGIAPIFR